MTSTNPRETVRRLAVFVLSMTLGTEAKILHTELWVLALKAFILSMILIWALNPWVKAGER